MLKFIINMNHRLCAKVTDVKRTDQGGVYHVRCIQNLGGRRTVDYLVDGAANSVVRM